MTMQDRVAVGDLNSDARGSGARKNAGKPQWWQLPLMPVHRLTEEYASFYTSHIDVAQVIQDLGEWQRGADNALTAAMTVLLTMLANEQGVERHPRLPPLRALESTVAVLEFGALKYPATQEGAIDKLTGRPTPAAAGNWAKGMPWSVCLSCALSHLFAAAQGEKLDNESGLSHLAHAMCNLLFLAQYRQTYPEGDDRIKQFRFVMPGFTLGEDEINPRVDVVVGDHP